MDDAPACSPDGNWIMYSSGSEKGFSLVRVPIAGGLPEILLGRPYPLVVGRYSPNGRQIGLLIVENEQNMHIKLAVMDSRTGSVERTFAIPFGTPPDNMLGGLRWTPDGQALAFLLEEGGIRNLWIQPLSGGPPRQLTHSGQVVSFAWSPDGKQLAVTRAHGSSDVVLFSNFR
jgi:eukaryotic-like serine/threonine-protein kinase